MILAKLLGTPDLAKTQVFCIYETTKVVMISKNKDLIFATCWIMPPCFEGFNNGQKLTVVSFVSSFGKNRFTQEVIP